MNFKRTIGQFYVIKPNILELEFEFLLVNLKIAEDLNKYCNRPGKCTELFERTCQLQMEDKQRSNCHFGVLHLSK
eukprot:UN20669